MFQAEGAARARPKGCSHGAVRGEQDDCVSQEESGVNQVIGDLPGPKRGLDFILQLSGRE